jgi:hypothetical protein
MAVPAVSVTDWDAMVPVCCTMMALASMKTRQRPLKCTLGLVNWEMFEAVIILEQCTVRVRVLDETETKL